jgi:outer membrane lipoprotein-sorting protein
MKRFFKIIGGLLLLLLVAGVILFMAKNETLPLGEKGKNADALAMKMQQAIHADAYHATEVLEWSFRDEHHYKWFKNENSVTVSWDQNKVILNTKNPKKSTVFVDNKKVEDNELIQTATDYFNNDSFWLVAPYKVFDPGTERRIVKHQGKDALLITYTSGGTTPGDSYLWILADTGVPISFKMWTKIIPIGGVEASWSDVRTTESGILLPTTHTLSLFGMKLPMGAVKSYNPKANALANKILKAINHDNYKETNHIAWSFGSRRHYQWNKKEHIVAVSWDTIRVSLHPDNLEKSSIFFNNKLSETADKKIIKKATDLFNNDSFWLVAPHKLFENGIVRSIQKQDGKDALHVKYTTGGSTPGDSYLWIVDENYIPKSYKMFVPSMNMDGVPASWEDWISTESGTLLPTSHSFGAGKKLSMGNVKATR